MAVKDLINQISRSKIVSKAKELIDRDKEREGIQFISPNLKQNISQGVENYFNQPRQQISASGLAYRTAKNIGQQIKEGTEALKARQESINQRTQGLSFLDRLKSPATQQENQQLLKGVKTAGIALAPINLPFTLASMGLAGGFQALQGQDPAQAMAQTAFTAPVSGQFIKVTNPLIKGTLSKIKAPQIVQNRITPAIANVAQGLGIDVATGQKTTPLSVGIDVLTGVAGQQGQFGDIATGKGFDVGRTSKTQWTLEDKNLFDGLNDYLRKNYKKLSDQEVDNIDKQLSTLANGYLSNDTINRIATKHQSNTKGFLNEIASELQKSIKSQEGIGAIKMGFAEPRIRTTLTKELKNDPLEKIIQEGRNKIGGVIPEENKTTKEWLDSAYTQWVDRYYPISKKVSEAKKYLKTQGAELRPEYNPDYLVRRLTGAGGIANARFKNELDPILKEIETSGIDKLDMDTYLANKRMAGLVGRDIYGVDPVKSGKIVQALNKKYGNKILEEAEKLYRYQDKGFQEMIDSGFISPENANIIKTQNPDYSPLYRVMDQVDNYLGVPTKKTMQGTQPIAKLKGSTRQIESPLESIIANTFKQRAAIEKNEVAKSIVNLQDITDLGFKKVSKAGEDTITIWKDGKKEYWNVGQDIVEVAKGTNEEAMNLVLKLIQAPASLLRQGATGRNPEFMIPNIIRDQLDAGITSKYGYVPFVDYLSGLKSILTNDDVYKKWESSGANIDLGEMSGKKSIKAYFDEKTAKKGLFNWIGSGLDILGEFSEQPTRVGLFKKAYKSTKNPLLAMMESRDATVDFARMGSKMKVANSIIPFLNVGVQGFDKLIRSVKNNPAKVLFNATLYGAMPAITSTLYNLTNYPEEYQEIPQYEKDSNFILVTGRNDDGTVDYVSFPKGNIIPTISNPVESFINYAFGNDQQSFKEMAFKTLSSTLPVVGDGGSLKEIAVKTIGSNIPQAIKPLAENLLNKSFYKYDEKKGQTKEIVPFYLQNKPEYQQTYQFTPQLYQKIGAVLNASPLKVKNLLEGYLAGYVKIPAQAVEILTKVSRGEEVSPNDKTIIRRFVKQTYETSGGVEKPEIKTPGIMERVTGKVSAKEETGIVTQQAIDQIKENIKYGNKVSEKELYSAYLNKPLSMKSTNKYEKSLRDSELYGKISDINSNEYLSEDQKNTLMKKIATELQIPKTELDYYQVANKTVDQKTMYVLDQVPRFTNENEFVNYLVEGRRKVNGQQLISSGVIDNLVDEGLISESLGKQLKKVTFDKKTGKVGTGRAKKAKVIEPPTFRVSTSRSKIEAPKIKAISGLQPSKYKLKQPTLKTDDIKIKIK